MSTFSVTFTTPQTVQNIAPEVIETAFKRRLNIELNRLLEEEHLGDALSLDLVAWIEGFLSALRTNLDVGPIFESYVTLLKEMLLDPITQTPLDQNALLGSDGYCYGYHVLCLFTYALPEELHWCSPLQLDEPSEELFLTVPHHFVRSMVNWLVSHGEFHPSEEIVANFMTLQTNLGERQVRRLIPNERNARLHRISRAVGERSEQHNVIETSLNNIHSFQESVENYIRKEFEEVADRVNQFANTAIEGLSELESRTEQHFQQLEQRIFEVQKEENLLEKEIEKLESQISYVESEIDSAEKEELKVRLEIKKLERIMEKRKKEKAAAFWKTLAIVSFTSLGTYFLQQFVLPNLNIALLPENGGGALSLSLTQSNLRS